MKSSIKIADLTLSGGLAFDLVDIVSLFRSRSLHSNWRAQGVWTVQEGDDAAFEEMCNRGEVISGERFCGALGKVMQVIDGRFEAFDPDGGDPWVVIEAVDSSYFVMSAEDSVLAVARSHFRSVTEYPA